MTMAKLRRLAFEPLENRRLLAVGDLMHTLQSENLGPGTSAIQGVSVATSVDYYVTGLAGADADGFPASGLVKIYDTSTHELRFTLHNPTPAEVDNFGMHLAMSGDYLVVGVHGDDRGTHDAGIAYVYDLGSPTPTTPLFTLANPRTNSSDFFGRSVAVAGQYVVVGAPQDDAGERDAGAAYVYDLGSAHPTSPIFMLDNPTPGVSDFFGYAVAVTGNQVFVSSPQDDVSATDAGSVFVYDLTSNTPTQPVATLNNPAPAASDNFGRRLAASGDYLVVGSRYDDAWQADSGSAYVYDISSLTHTTPIASLTNPAPGVSDYFGVSVAVAGNYAVVGAAGDDVGAVDVGTAFVYDLASATPGFAIVGLPNPTPAVADEFGYAVAVAGDHVLIGAYGDDTAAEGAGSAYAYDLSSTTPGNPVATFNAHLPASRDQFGRSVAAVGDYVVVGAPEEDAAVVDAGAVYVFDVTSPAPTESIAVLHNPTPERDDEFGCSVAAAGTQVVVGAWKDNTGARNAGIAYVYDLDSATPTTPLVTLTNPEPGVNDCFGYAVAMAGSIVVVGAYSDDWGEGAAGSAYVYDLVSATPATPIATLHNPTPASRDSFGKSVAVAGDIVAVAAHYDDTMASNAGAVYVYDLGSATPTTPTATLTKPSASSSDYFGYSVAATDDYVVVGVRGDDTSVSNAGAAYLYDLASPTPTVAVAILNNPNPASSDYFGHSVAISGAYVVVGEAGDDTGSSAAGTAHVYELASAASDTPVATLRNPTPTKDDQFGHTVAVSGTMVVVGAPWEDAQNVDQGEVTTTGPLPSRQTNSARRPCSITKPRPVIRSASVRPMPAENRTKSNWSWMSTTYRNSTSPGTAAATAPVGAIRSTGTRMPFPAISTRPCSRRRSLRSNSISAPTRGAEPSAPRTRIPPARAAKGRCGTPTLTGIRSTWATCPHRMSTPTIPRPPV